MFDALDNNLQQNLLEVIPNDADHKPKPQRFQDFLKVLQISNRLNFKVTPSLIPSTGMSVVEPTVSKSTGISGVSPTLIQNLSSISEPKLESQIPQKISAVSMLPQQQQQPLPGNSIVRFATVLIIFNN
ncbi:hypothetical protein LOAG_10549 [Loa loa]|uniref:Uncharacterized protein n=2 Tax=Loa loa TaxID=7209 RepID=A0A1S0TQ89_LOALO|nr:hypothetical protein LOAG_10549 [Loa loa]EFO17950.1 hypothetical protein LOAG_10549 [Loa loa]